MTSVSCLLDECVYEYFALKYRNRIASYNLAAKIHGKSAEELRKHYASRGGLEAFFADRMGLTYGSAEFKSVQNDSKIQKCETIFRRFYNKSRAGGQNTLFDDLDRMVERWDALAQQMIESGKACSR